jgi:hypothetical protein
MRPLTDEQIRETVATMLPTDAAMRAELLRQALSGDASARFVVYAAWRRASEPGTARRE